VSLDLFFDVILISNGFVNSDCDKSVAVEIRHDDKLPPEDNVYVQVALLYTSCGGQRRLRILNLALKTCTQLADLFRSCDLDTLTLFLAKQVSFNPRIYFLIPGFNLIIGFVFNPRI
jgi:hypothetical protein